MWTSIALLVALPLVSARYTHERRADTCGLVGYDVGTKAYDYTEGAAVSTLAGCGASCLKDSKCKSFAIGENACMLYTVAVTGNFRTSPGSPFKFYDRSCAPAPTSSTTRSSTTTTKSTTASVRTSISAATLVTTSARSTTSSSQTISALYKSSNTALICGSVCFDKGTPKAYDFFATTTVGTVSSCSSRCGADANCKSFVFSNQGCLIYASKVAGNFDADPTSSYRFYDVACPVATTTTSSGPTTSSSAALTTTSSSTSSSTTSSSTTTSKGTTTSSTTTSSSATATPTLTACQQAADPLLVAGASFVKQCGHGFVSTASTSIEMPVGTDFNTCLQRCVDNTNCVAAEFGHASNFCVLVNAMTEVQENSNVDIAQITRPGRNPARMTTSTVVTTSTSTTSSTTTSAARTTTTSTPTVAPTPLSCLQGKDVIIQGVTFQPICVAVYQGLTPLSQSSAGTYGDCLAACATVTTCSAIQYQHDSTGSCSLFSTSGAFYPSGQYDIAIVRSRSSPTTTTSSTSSTAATTTASATTPSTSTSSSTSSSITTTTASACPAPTTTTCPFGGAVTQNPVNGKTFIVQCGHAAIGVNTIGSVQSDSSFQAGLARCATTAGCIGIVSSMVSDGIYGTQLVSSYTSTQPDTVSNFAYICLSSSAATTTTSSSSTSSSTTSTTKVTTTSPTVSPLPTSCPASIANIVYQGVTFTPICNAMWHGGTPYNRVAGGNYGDCLAACAADTLCGAIQYERDQTVQCQLFRSDGGLDPNGYNDLAVVRGRVVS